jgi:hypothetical protein
MRLSNDRDQALVRSAVSDAAANLLSFIPSLGTREVFTFGSGVALPTRMRFKELPAERRPNSEASGNTRSDGGAHVERDLSSSVIDRWRSATMSHRMSEDEYADYGAPSDTPPLQPSPPQTPACAGRAAKRPAREPAEEAAGCEFIGRRAHQPGLSAAVSIAVIRGAAERRTRNPEPINAYPVSGFRVRVLRTRAGMTRHYFTATTSMSADMPPWPGPSLMTVS